MKIGVSMFLTEKTGNPGAIAREAEQLGFESFWVAEHLVMPATYSTWYPRGKDGIASAPFRSISMRNRL